ncbi:MAG: hypothetical protein IT384_09390 [Deltaproteobacteria bacterium]|nr:hypothetical protein [Deltaproteobacteria bacterium]
MRRHTLTPLLPLHLFLLASCGSADPGASGPGDAGDPGDAGPGDPAQNPGAPPLLQSASARITGRRGADLHLSLHGSDADQDASALVLRAFGTGNRAIAIRDSDLDGRLDAYDTTIALDAIFAGESFVAELGLPGFAADVSDLEALGLQVRDRTGRVSAPLQAVVAAQPIRSAGESCDPESLRDRCAHGLACRGAPPACVEGVAPVLARFSYLRAAEGARILLAGRDPDDDVAAVRLDFLDGAGNPVTVDLDGDDVAESASFVAQATEASQGGEFFLAIETGDGFEAVVARLAATVIDDGDRSSESVLAPLSVAPRRTRGQGCDPRGFDACATGLVCSPGLVGAVNTCQDPTALRGALCRSHSRLEVADASLWIEGEAEGVSLWDAPQGCAAHDPVERAEGTVLLHLAAPVARLVLSTEHPETEFDTVLYLIDGCNATIGPILACNDDTRASVGSSLELTDVPAGDYLVVVDAWGERGGRFALSVTR